MSAAKNSKILHTVKVILDIFFWLLVIASVLMLLWTALSPVIMRLTGIPITSSAPVTIGQGVDPRMEVVISGAETSGIRMAYIEDAQGTLRIETHDWYLNFISNLAKLVTGSGLAYLAYLLRSIVISIMQGDVFTPENVVRVRRLGYLVLGVAFVQASLEYLAAYEFFRLLEMTSPPISLPSPFEAGTILASLLILALAQVWSYGLELEQDRALTI
jgi:hypothetical protein